MSATHCASRCRRLGILLAASTRLEFIRERIERGAKPSRQWALGWGIGLGGARLANIGGIVGQVMIITQPTPMVRALDAYRAGPPSSGWSVRPLSLLGGGGVAIGGAI